MKKPPIFQFFIQQFLLTLACCLGFWALKGYVAAYSALIGGMIFSVPQLYFGLKAFRYMGARSTHLIVQNFYKGESTKILLVALSFACVFKLVNPLDVMALFFAFVVNVAGNALAPLLPGSKPGQGES